MAKGLAASENRKAWLTRALPNLGDAAAHGTFQDDAVNAGAALTACGPVADWSSDALPIGSAIVP
jgi:hypothetical protein